MTALSRVSVPFDYKRAGFKSIDELTQPVYKAAGKIEPSEAEIQSGVLITEHGARLNHPQTFILGQEITKKVGSKAIPFSLQTSYDRVPTDPNYKEKLQYKWNYNSHLLLQKTAKRNSGVITTPEVEIKGDEVLYTGELIEVKFKEDDGVVDVLERAGVFNRGKHEIHNGSISFENDVSSVGSFWSRGEDCFSAGASGPSDGNDLGLAAFELVEPSSKKKQKVRKVADKEHQELLERLRLAEEKAHKYDALIGDLKKHI